MSFSPVPRADKDEVFHDRDSEGPGRGLIDNSLLGGDFLPGAGDDRTIETGGPWVVGGQKGSEWMQARLAAQHPGQAALCSQIGLFPVREMPLILEEFLPYVDLESFKLPCLALK